MEAAVTEATTTTDREDLAEKASEFLLGVLERMGIAADIDIKDDADKTVLDIQTGDTELVIGRRGVVLDALQHLVNKAVFKEIAASVTERAASHSSSMPAAFATSRLSGCGRSRRRWARRRCRPSRSSSSNR